jgi:hypothetical protein
MHKIISGSCRKDVLIAKRRLDEVQLLMENKVLQYLLLGVWAAALNNADLSSQVLPINRPLILGCLEMKYFPV